MYSRSLYRIFAKPKSLKNVVDINDKILIRISQNCRCSSFSSEAKSEDQTHFGYENVSKKEKAERVHNVFENVASKYDLMNDLMSVGVHRLWKDYFVSCLNPTSHSKILDVAGGTGDIAFRIAKRLKNMQKNETVFNSPISSTPSAENIEVDSHNITVCDISQNMLTVGEKRSEGLGYKNIKWVVGDAQSLPFDDSSFDAYTIAYGMRNVVDIEQALDEAYRVLKPGGRFLCLEFSEVHNEFLKGFYDAYSFQMIPVMGQLVTGDWKSYQYLVESIRKFPNQEAYKEIIEDSGFRKVTFTNLSFGVTAIHSGFKI